MARRRQSIIDALLVLPWWTSVIAAAVAYAICVLVFPAYFASSPLTTRLGGAAKAIGPYAAALFLLVGFLSFLRSYVVRRKFGALDGLEGIRSLSWRQFEAIVGEAFRRRGFSVTENAVDGPDGGIDLVLRTNGDKFYVQCKHWKQRRVGVKPIRELYGVIAARGARGGFFVASGDYSEEARAFAKQAGIELIDGTQLASMIEEVSEPRSFMHKTTGKRKPTISPEDQSSEPPDIESSESFFHSGLEPPDSLDRSPFGEESSGFVSGVMKIALGIVIGGVILWGLLELYVRYRVNQLANAVEHVAEQMESDIDSIIRSARERELARQQQLRLEKARRAAETQMRAEQEKALAAEQARKEAAWAAFYQPSEECLKTASVECGNAYIRARREFERRYAAGEI